MGIYTDDQVLQKHLQDVLAGLGGGSGTVSTGTPVSVRDTTFGGGAVGDGVTDDTAAIALAHASGHPVFYPYGTYKHVGPWPVSEGGILGEGVGVGGSAQNTRIVFYNCTDPQAGAITPKQTGGKAKVFRIENVQLLASSWDATTGCLGYGLDIGSPVILRNVYIGNFKRSNLWFHQVDPVVGAYVTAPYESLIENVYSAFAGEHGCLVGAGANVLTFLNYEGKWSGAPSYGVAPTVAGTGDGLRVANTADGHDISLFVPQALTVLGGDCSYNAGYGWNFDGVRDSVGIAPGYAELNLVNQARVGNDTSNADIRFGVLATGIVGFTNALAYAPYFYNTRVSVGGKQVHPVDFFDFIANPQAEDGASPLTNASSRLLYLSRSHDGTQTAYVSQNVSPDGVAATLASETIATLRGNGTYSLGIGSGSRHLKVTPNVVRLPDLYYQGATSGWTAASVARGVASAVPTSGTWAVGDRVDALTPLPGGPVGWVCVTAGTPGTWLPVVLGGGTYNAGNSSTALTLNWVNGHTQRVTLTGNVTFTFSNPTDGARYQVRLATGAGSFTVTWPATVAWPGGTPPVITAAAAATDVVVLVYAADTTKYYANVAQGLA